MTKQEQILCDKIARLDNSRGFVDNFDSFIDFALLMFLANPTKEQRENFAAHQQDKEYLGALQQLGELSEDYHDALGDMFMDSISHGANGQFFTPEPICQFMAKITDNENDSVYDPTCGSGRFLLAGMQNARDNHKTEPFVYGCDLDHRCVRMSLLNVCLNSGRGDIEWGNTLSMEIYKTYHIDRVMVGNKWMSFVWQYDKGADMDALNEERQKTIRQLAEYGCPYEFPRRKRQEPEDVKESKPEKVETIEEQPIPPIVEPKRKAPIQLSLF